MSDTMALSQALDPALPADVRAMNATALVLAAVAALALLAAALNWAIRQPVFSIRAIRMEGEVTRNSAATLRAHTAARLNGSSPTIQRA